MRHRNSGRKLSRTSAHREALFRNMAKALLTHGRITTTETKAKELRGVIEPLISFGLKNDLHARREAYRVLGNHKLVKRLFDDIAPAYAGIPGGFTRVVKLALPRKGDAAPMAVIEMTKDMPALVDKAVKPAKAIKPREKKPREEGDRDSKPRAATLRAAKAAFKTPRAPKAAPKASAPKKLKIGGE